MTTEHEVLDGELVDERPGLPAIPAGRAVDRLDDRARRRRDAAMPINTKRAYARLVYGRIVKVSEDGKTIDAGPAGPVSTGQAGIDWADMAWVPWCRETGRPSGLDGVPASEESLGQWVSELADLRVGAPQIEQAIYAVRRLHRDNKMPGQPQTDTALAILRTYRRDEGGARPVDRAKPLETRSLRQMLNAMPTGPDGQLSPIGVRDAFVLVAGVKAMLRRSELLALRIEHTRVGDRGVELWLPASKTDKDAKGAKIVIPRDDAGDPKWDVTTLLAAWLRLLAEQGITTGPLVRSVNRHGRIGGPLNSGAKDIDRLVKRAAVRAGLDPDGWKGHSMRSGGASAAHAGGASYGAIQRQGRWLSLAQVMVYIRDAEQWTGNAASRIHL
jgi:integrase